MGSYLIIEKDEDSINKLKEFLNNFSDFYFIDS